VTAEQDDFVDAALTELAFLFDYGFRVTERERSWVHFESAEVVVTAGISPLGEVDIAVSRLGDESGHGTLTLSGQVGTASAARVVELLAAKLRLEEPALRGDESFFRALEAEQAQASKEFTDWASGQGPEPSRGRLP
jgi:hypothetical protein